jgi:hypothetical protein
MLLAELARRSDDLMPAEKWAKDAVLNELAVARDASETRTFEDLRETIGIGHEDLQAAITELGDAAKLSEVAPSEYVLLDTNAAAREQAAAAVDEPGVSLEEAEAQAGGMPRTRAAARAAGAANSRVVLPRSVAQSLDEAALGQIVKAGIDGAEGDFSFEVTA